ncbi:MAG: hypothetical protein ACOYON_00040 [Fimbriimonas sp.]
MRWPLVWLLGAVLFWILPGNCLAKGGFELSDSFLEPPMVNRPTEVTANLYLEDVNRIDVTAHSFDVTAQLVMQWRDVRLAKLFRPEDPLQAREFEGFAAIEILKKLWHPEVEILNERGQRKTGVRGLEIHRDGRVSLFEKFDSQAHLEGDMYFFPFTVARLRLAFDAFSQNGREMKLTPGAFGAQAGLTMDEVVVGPWSYLSKGVESRESRRADEPDASYSRVDFVVDVQRDIPSGVAITILPILLIWICSTALLWIDSGEFTSYAGPRIGGLVTLLLTSVALQLTLETRLPSVHYLTAPNLLFYETILLLTSGICLSVVYMHLYHRVSKEKARLFDRRLRFGYPIFAVVFLVVALAAFSYQVR